MALQCLWKNESSIKLIHHALADSILQRQIRRLIEKENKFSQWLVDAFKISFRSPFSRQPFNHFQFPFPTPTFNLFLHFLTLAS
jgi:hypothetical protein